ncbi:MAG: phage portal protein [Ruminococcus sp.]|nr:phage portal protein [Ruminococcus sp.]
MGLFPRKRQRAVSSCGVLQSVPRQSAQPEAFEDNDQAQQALYAKLRAAVPVIDAAIGKIVRLTGSFQLVCSNARMQGHLDDFVANVPVGLTGTSLQCFANGYLDSLLTYGNALGEMLIDPRTGALIGLQTVPSDRVQVCPDRDAMTLEYWLHDPAKPDKIRIAHPERILFTALAPPPGGIYGVSILHGLPALSEILLRIYTCIGQNYDRMRNIHYAVTYKPSGDPAERAYAGDRARQIAKEWSEGMRAGAHGEIRDFVCAVDVDIRVIGADNALIDTEVPVRQLLEQLVAKLSIPPFLLGLNWSSTERMSTQQADILTSELEYYRRLLEPVLRQIGTAFLRLSGSTAQVAVTWDNINLQDETELAQARLWNAQAQQLETAAAT